MFINLRSFDLISVDTLFLRAKEVDNRRVIGLYLKVTDNQCVLVSRDLDVLECFSSKYDWSFAEVSRILLCACGRFFDCLPCGQRCVNG